MKTKAKNLDRLLWALIWIVPFIGYIVTYWRTGEAIPIFTYIDTNFAFEFVKDITDNIWQQAFNCSLVISGYMSFLVAVEIAHCLFDAVVFIPRFAQRIIERSEKGVI